MDKPIDYEKAHFCPVYGKEIDSDLCYESLMCLKKFFKTSSVPELDEVKDIEAARQKCQGCEYSEL